MPIQHEVWQINLFGATHFGQTCLTKKEEGGGGGGGGGAPPPPPPPRSAPGQPGSSYACNHVSEHCYI